MVEKTTFEKVSVPESGMYALVYMAGDYILVSTEDGLFTFGDNRFFRVPKESNHLGDTPYTKGVAAARTGFVQAVNKMAAKGWAPLGNIIIKGDLLHQALCRGRFGALPAAAKRGAHFVNAEN